MTDDILVSNFVLYNVNLSLSTKLQQNLHFPVNTIFYYKNVECVEIVITPCTFDVFDNWP